jgi:heterodisulfide reductase subunit B
MQADERIICCGSFDVGKIKVARRYGLEFVVPPVHDFQLLALAQGLGAARES